MAPEPERDEISTARAGYLAAEAEYGRFASRGDENTNRNDAKAKRDAALVRLADAYVSDLRDAAQRYLDGATKAATASDNIADAIRFWTKVMAVATVVYAGTYLWSVTHPLLPAGNPEKAAQPARR